MASFDTWTAFWKTRRLWGAVSVENSVEMLWASAVFVQPAEWPRRPIPAPRPSVEPGVPCPILKQFRAGQSNDPNTYVSVTVGATPNHAGLRSAIAEELDVPSSFRPRLTEVWRADEQGDHDVRITFTASTVAGEARRFAAVAKVQSDCTATLLSVLPSR